MHIKFYNTTIQIQALREKAGSFNDSNDGQVVHKFRVFCVLKYSHTLPEQLQDIGFDGYQPE